MASLKINRLVMALRAGEDVANFCFPWFLEEKNLIDEIELFQDFEDLQSLLRNQILNFLSNRTGHIYVAENGTEYFKVGRTIDPSSRLKSLNTAGVLHEIKFIKTFKVIDAVSFETKIHAALKEKFPKKKEFFLGNKESILELTTTVIIDLGKTLQTNLLKIGLDIQHVGI